MLLMLQRILQDIQLAPGRPIVTVTVTVVLPGRIAVIPVLSASCIQTQYCSCWEIAEHGLECYIKDSTCRTASRYWRWCWSCWIAVGVGVGVGVAVGVGVSTVGVGVGTTVGVGVCVCGGLSLWSANPVTELSLPSVF